jgi:NitT/TauT family transport system ATP-binding protein
MTATPAQSDERSATQAAERRTVVEASGLSLTFETADSPVHALSEVDLRVAHGEFVSLIGPSGCGKTTLLRVIADLEQPTAGRIEVNGVSPHQARLDRSYGYVFQAPALYPWRNIERNVTLPLEIMGMSRQERAKCAGKYLELVDLAGFEKKFPWQLSGGMQLRRARRDRPRPSQRTASEIVGQDPQDRGFRHPLDPRGGLPVYPDRCHVAAPWSDH